MTSRSLALAFAILGLSAVPASAFIGPLSSDVAREHAPLLDVRLKSAGTPSVPAAVKQARAALKRSMGAEGVVSVDRVTGAVRWLGRTDGYLTGPQTGTPRELALQWAREHLDVLGIGAKDLAGLKLANEYRAPNGVTRLIFQQTYKGVPAFDSTLRVNVAKDGRIVNVGGRPRANVRVASVVPKLTATQAVIAAAAGAGAKSAPKLTVLGSRADARRTTSFLGRHSAKLSLVAMDEKTTVLAWRVWFEESQNAAWDMLVDARTGKLIRRANQVKFANGLAWDYYPGAPKGGTPREVDFSKWLTAEDKLVSNFTHNYNDADGTEDFTTDTADPTQSSMGDIVTPNEEIRPQGIVSGDWLYEYTPIPSPAGFCPAVGCIWDHAVNASWVPNVNEDGTQAFFFVNTFAEHLKAPPISFDERANFQFSNAGGTGKDNDGIYASNMDAAAQVAGRPIPLLWSDNANMLTRPDGQSPRMQMFLFEPIQAGEVIDYPFSDVSGSSDASVIYHEFTHGLTNRLVIDGDGNGALNSVQSGSMGEAWSDFYAMDFLIAQGFEQDTDTPGETKVGIFVDGGQNLVRTEPIDCRPGDDEKACPRRRGLTKEGGGYTYEEFGKIIAGGAEVHADGEIWAQTLMDFRRRMTGDHGPAKGSERAETYITRGLELSVDEPSFIDMRNAILQADVIAGKRDHRRIWETWAARGMGAGAAAVDGADTAPTAAFNLPAGLPASDQLGPAVTIDSPADNGVVRAEAAVISGTAADDAGVTKLMVNSEIVPVTDGATWTATIKLAPGRQTVRAIAVDIEDRQAITSRTVLADAKAPSLGKIKVRKRGRRLLITGTARDDIGVAGVRIGKKTVPAGKGGRFFLAMKPSKKKKVTVTVIDRAGRTAKKSLRLR